MTGEVGERLVKGGNKPPWAALAAMVAAILLVLQLIEDADRVFEYAGYALAAFFAFMFFRACFLTAVDWIKEQWPWTRG